MERFSSASPFLCMDLTYITALLKEGFGFRDNTLLQVRRSSISKAASQILYLSTCTGSFFWLTSYWVFPGLLCIVAVMCNSQHTENTVGNNCFFFPFIVNKKSEQHRDKLDFGCYLSLTAVSGDNILNCDIPMDFSISESLRKQTEISRYVIQLESVTEWKSDQSYKTDPHLGLALHIMKIATIQLWLS